jgi:hypothetical protein
LVLDASVEILPVKYIFLTARKFFTEQVRQKNKIALKLCKEEKSVEG